MKLPNEVLQFKQSRDKIMNFRRQNGLNRLKTNDKYKDKGEKEKNTKKGRSERHYIY